MELIVIQIQEILPHRYPFQLVDRITDMNLVSLPRDVNA